MSFTGEQHQFESLEAALAYLKERDQGDTLKYWGWGGQIDGYYTYTFTAKTGIKYLLAVYKNGMVRIMK